MYLHFGSNVVVSDSSVVAIFDIDNATSARATRDFLSLAEKRGQIVNIAGDIPKSFIICAENGKTTVYLSQLSSKTLDRRSQSPHLD